MGHLLGIFPAEFLPFFQKSSKKAEMSHSWKILVYGHRSVDKVRAPPLPIQTLKRPQFVELHLVKPYVPGSAVFGGICWFFSVPGQLAAQLRWPSKSLKRSSVLPDEPSCPLHVLKTVIHNHPRRRLKHGNLNPDHVSSWQGDMMRPIIWIAHPLHFLGGSIIKILYITKYHLYDLICSRF